MGELLAETVEQGRLITLQGARLKDLGIDYTQSHRYQRMAASPFVNINCSGLGDILCLAFPAYVFSKAS